jgi:hypothetical protein
MNRKRLASLACLLAYVLVPPLGAQNLTPYSTGVNLRRTILLCEFESAAVTADASPGQLYQTVAARVHVSRVLKDADAAGLTPGFYDVTIPRSEHKPGLLRYPAWMDRDLKPGLIYMVFSDAKGDIRKAIEDPMSVELLTDKVDTVGDVELILGSSSLPAAAQIPGAVAALDSPKLHGNEMAQYVAWLLFANSDAETAPLFNALQGKGAMAFSDSGKSALLDHLLSRAIIPQAALRTNLLSALTDLAVRYFIAQPEEPATRGRPEYLATTILTSYLPAIRRLPAAAAALQRVRLTADDAARLRSKALAFALDKRLTPEWQAQARDLLSLFPAQ